MAFGIGVNLPQVTSFLMLYPLCLGAVVTCYWTLFRSAFVFLFFMWSALEVFSPHSPPFGGFFPSKPTPPSESGYHIALFSYLVLIVSEAFLILFTLDYAAGLYFEEPERIERYLFCRFVAWIMEVIFLALICVTHSGLIGWYLIILMFIILEFYGFIVVFSFYKDMENDPRKCPGCM